jgi:conjugative transfer signal peptidase TraF
MSSSALSLTPLSRPRRSTSPWTTALALSTLALCAATATSSIWARRTLLINGTASEPLGLYARVEAAAGAGRIVAFNAPPAAFPYADHHLSYLHQVPMLKTVAGVAGDRVCTSAGRLMINGRDLAPIVAFDREGRALPHWIDCRVLRPGEVFVFSGRVPNSFDSRYFGPVPAASILGVYAPLLTLGKAS